MKIKYLTILPLAACVCPTLVACQNAQNDPTIFEINNLLQTPYKYDIVLQEPGMLTDSPTVFRHNNKWYMTYINVDAQKVAEEPPTDGYETYITQSDDLLHWSPGVKILARRPGSGDWDSNQIAGYMGFINNDLFGDYSLQGIGENYYIPYLGGQLDGYETDPLAIGEAWIKGDLMNPASYHRFEKPILTRDDPDAREGEKQTLYKSCMFIDRAKTLGHKYVNFYNAKAKDATEGVFIATSDDGIEWHRYGKTHVFKDFTVHNTGDPVILKYKNIYIMLYYVLTFDGKTFDNFAISKDLVHWDAWDGAPLIESSKEGYDAKYAHKPSIVYKDGVLYHFYCCVDNDNNRHIALATSKPLK